MKQLLILLFFGLCIAHSSKAQVKIGDNPQTIDAASVLELESTDKVLVITRVTTAQMNAIFPLQGAMVYNTDVQSVHYFDGTQWVNVGGGGGTGGPLTADPIVNDVPTIVITPTGTSDNLEVAENSIGTLQIADGGVNGTLDIQDGSIGPGKLQNQSVTQEKLSENSVGAFALDNDNIGLEAFSNANTQFITAANVVSTDADNALQIGGDLGAFYDETPLIGAIQDNADAINNIGIPNLDEVLQEGNNALNKKITGLAAPTDPADAATKAYVDGLTGGGGSTEVVDGTTLIGAGTPTDQFRINPSTTVGQYLRTTAAGVVWDNIPAGTGTPDLSEVLAEGTDGGAALIKNILDPVDPQDAATRAFVLTTVASGGTVTDGSIIIGGAGDTPQQLSVSGDARLANTGELTIAANAIEASMIQPAAALDPVADQVLITTDAGAVEWQPFSTGGGEANMATNEGTAGVGLVLAKNGINLPFKSINSGGSSGIITVTDDTAENEIDLDIADNSVTLNKIAPNGALTDGQIIQWSTDLDGPGPNTDAGWEVADNAAGHLGTSPNNVFYADTDGTPIDTGDNDVVGDNNTLGDNGGFMWDPTKRFNSGTLFLGFKANGNPGGTSLLGDYSKLAVAEKLGGLAFPIQVVNETTGIGSSTGILFSVDATSVTGQPTLGRPGAGGLVFERIDANGRGDFHFLVSADSETKPELTDKVLTVENDGDVVLTGNIVARNGAGTNGQVLTTNAAGETEWGTGAGIPDGADDNDILIWEEDDIDPDEGTWIIGSVVSNEQDIALDATADQINLLASDGTTVNSSVRLDGATLEVFDNNTAVVGDDVIRIKPATPTSMVPAEQKKQILVTSPDGTTLGWEELPEGTLPNGGSNFQVLTTDGAGGISWATPRATELNLNPSLDIDGDAGTADETTVQGAITALAAQSGHNGTAAGSVFFAANSAPFAPIENNAQLYWDNTNTKLYVGPQNTTAADVKLNVGGTTRTQGLKNSSGSATTPAYRFTDDLDTGMYHLGDNLLAFTTNGTDAMTINPNGNVAIGAINANSKLEVFGSFATEITTIGASTVLGVGDHTVILNGNHNITLPAAGSCKGRIYIIKNATGTTPTISDYEDNLGVTQTTIGAGILHLQSDGADWQQINN